MVITTYVYGWNIQVKRQIGSFLEALIHSEYVVRGSKHHVTSSFSICKNHGLEHINHLRDIGHLHTITMTMEQIKGECGHESVTHGILLV